MLSSKGSTLFLCTENELVFVDINFGEKLLGGNVKKCCFEQLSCSTVVLHCLSASKKFVCLFDSNKNAILLNHDNGNFENIASCTLNRLPSCATFSPDDAWIIIGDKSGNVYRLATSDLPGRLAATDPVLGHLSILSDVAVPDDCSVIATSDRDDKIRISRFTHPYVIQAFCLGHTSYVTQLAFVPASSILLSTGGDGYLRAWAASSGEELSSIHFPTPSGGAELPVVISRLLVPDNSFCVGCSSSHSVIFSIPFTITEPQSITVGPVSYVESPTGSPLIDLAVCSHPSNAPSQWIVVGLTDASDRRLVAWLVTQNPSDDQPSLLHWEAITVDLLSDESLEFPKLNPRLELLKALCKSFGDHSLVDEYEENKQSRHQRIELRRLRHQHKRKLRQLANQPAPVETS